ncbi:FmdB family zinc ribbon protein [Micromonospora sp. NPDC052213]|uniref:FmdB family zinc ribbon protein n=1 Tax=Micromonospora sp. NPDC052213 TaxID=3155812 RepID=UPI0034226DB6
MPTYQYACTACGHQLEAVQSFSDEPLTECPACDGQLRKLFNSVGIVFKGSGFYRTDSRTSGSDTGSGGAAKPAKSDSSSSGGDSGSSSGSTAASSSSSSSSSSSNGSGGGASKTPAASTASAS